MTSMPASTSHAVTSDASVVMARPAAAQGACRRSVRRDSCGPRDWHVCHVVPLHRTFVTIFDSFCMQTMPEGAMINADSDVGVLGNPDGPGADSRVGGLANSSARAPPLLIARSAPHRAHDARTISTFSAETDGSVGSTDADDGRFFGYADDGRFWGTTFGPMFSNSTSHDFGSMFATLPWDAKNAYNYVNSERQARPPRMPPCCDWCGIVPRGISASRRRRVCEACHSANYCSAACRRAAWDGGHWAACGPATKMPPAVVVFGCAEEAA